MDNNIVDQQSTIQAVFWWQQVVREIKSGKKGSFSSRENPEDRFADFVASLKSDSQQLELTRNAFVQLSAPYQRQNFFVSTIRLQTESFLQEFVSRIAKKLTQKGFLIGDADSLIHFLFDSSDVDWIEKIQPQDIFDFLKLMLNDEQRSHFAQELNVALNVLALQIYSLTLQWAISWDEQLFEIEKWPEAQLMRAHQSEVQSDPALLRDLLFRSFAKSLSAREKFTDRGVSIHLVHLLNQKEEFLAKYALLHDLSVYGLKQPLLIRTAFGQLISDAFDRKELLPFIAANLRLLAQRIVERNSQAGEHYVTRTWAEFLNMWHSALLGGGITAITVFVKLLIGKLGLKAFLLGLAEGLNYSLSFLTIAVAGGTLATKQPSATAPFIAKQLKASNLQTRKSLVALFRTQFIAIFGNIAAVVPICFVVSLLWSYFGKGFLDQPKAMQVFNSFHILGPSLLFASLTGVLLFASSLIGGWFENWCVVNRLKDRLENFDQFYHPRWAKFVRWFVENPSLIATNVSLGLLLGLVPQFFNFFSIPFEVRHVTLAAGQLAVVLGDLDLYNKVSWQQFFSVSGGVLLIGLANVFVSFALALTLAISSIGLGTIKLRLLFYSSVLTVVRKPWLLFVPEKPRVLGGMARPKD